MQLQFEVPYFGIDYKGEAYSGTHTSDWGEAFDVAGLNPDDVEEIFAADEGENDGASWICTGKLKDGSYFFLTAWCDYTGWDCQAGGEVFVCEDREDLNRMNMSNEERARLGIVLPEIESVKPITTPED